MADGLRGLYGIAIVFSRVYLGVAFVSPQSCIRLLGFQRVAQHACCYI